MPQIRKSVTIKVATDDLTRLKSSGYMLCFAIRVDGSFNTVWSKSRDFVASNSFSWSDQYQIFAKMGASGDSITNAVAIAAGQSATLAASGALAQATDAGPETAVTLVNRYGSVRPAVKQWASDIAGLAGFLTCYVAHTPIVKGQAPIYPEAVLKVWFSQDGQPLPQALVAHGVSEVATIDLRQVDTATRCYKNGSWSTA